MYHQTIKHREAISNAMVRSYKRRGIKPKPKPKKEVIIIYEDPIPRLGASNKVDWKKKYRELETATRRFLTNKGSGNTEKVKVRDIFIESYNKIVG